MLTFVKKLVVPFAAVALLAACSEEGETPVATINGESITESALHEKLVQQYGLEMLDQLVANKVIEMEAKKQDITVKETELNEEYAVYTEMYGSEEALEEFLGTYKMTVDDVKYDIEIYLLTKKLMEDYVAITEADVAAYFDEQKANYEDGATVEERYDELYAALFEERMNAQYETWLDELYEEYEITTTFFMDEEK